MATGLPALAIILLLGGVLLVAIIRKGDIKTTFKVPFLASFSLEAKDRRRPSRHLRS